jgi:hypothetical protein
MVGPPLVDGDRVLWMRTGNLGNAAERMGAKLRPETTKGRAAGISDLDLDPEFHWLRPLLE